MTNALFEKPIRNPSGWDEVTKAFVRSESAKIRTMIPAKVIQVDYENSMVLVQPLIRTWWEKYRPEVTMWPMEEIPILFTSAKRGVARITVPVRKGDVGLLLFADRHVEKYMGSTGEEVVDSGSMTTLGLDGFMNCIGFIPEIFTRSSKKGFDPERMVLEHGNAKITLHEDGEVVFGNGSVFSTLSAEGDYTSTNGEITSKLNFDGSGSLDNGKGKIELLASGQINLNGLIIDVDGTIPNLEVMGSLKKAGVEVSAP